MEKIEIRDYIASQITNENIDELQRMALAYALRHNIALDGPPGVGKTQSVIAFSKIIGKPIFEKGCSEDTTENQIIGFPKLIEKQGATVTDYENGPLTKAMESGGIFYGDEFNLLKRDKQKRLNSAFDDRRKIIRADDIEIKAKDNFLAIISYNPTRALSTQDLEESVADRFIHFHYNYMMPRIEAYLGALKSSEVLDTIRPAADKYSIILEKRAIIFCTKNNKKIINFLLYLPEKKTWVDFFTGKLNPEFDKNTIERMGIYYSHKRSKNHIFNPNAVADDSFISNHVKDFSLKITAFFNIIRKMSDHGSSAIPSNIKSAYSGLAEIGQIVIHIPSLRIQSSAISHLIFLLKSGMDLKLAINYSATLLVEQICFGKYRERKNGEFTNFEIITAIAESFGLIKNITISNLNTNFNKKVE